MVFRTWEILQEPVLSRFLFLWVDECCGAGPAKEPANPSGLEGREERGNEKFAVCNQRMHRSPLVCASSNRAWKDFDKACERRAGDEPKAVKTSLMSVNI